VNIQTPGSRYESIEGSDEHGRIHKQINLLGSYWDIDLALITREESGRFGKSMANSGILADAGASA
jgi:hypothetical protein